MMYNQGVNITTSLRNSVSFFARPSFGIALVCSFFIAASFNLAYHFASQYAYVDGSFINYRDLIFHIVDISVVLLLLWSFLYAGVHKTKEVMYGMGLMLLFALLLLVSHPEPVSIYGTIRLGMYGVCWLVAGEWLHKCLNERTCRDRKQFRLVLVVSLIVAASIQSCIGLLQCMNNRMLGIDALGESIVEVGGYGASSVYLPVGILLRAYGTFPHPNLLGGFLVASGIVGLFSSEILAKWLKEKWSKDKDRIVRNCISGAYAGFLILISLGIIATWSRSAITAWIIAVIIWTGSLFMKRWKKKGICMYIAALFIVLLSVGMWVSVGNDEVSRTLRERFINQSAVTDVSVSERSELNEEAMKMISNDPLFGVGIYGFTKEVADSELFGQGGIRLIQPVHNVVLLAISEVGLSGVIFLAAFAVILFRRITLSGYTVAAGMFLVISMMTDHYLWTLPQGLAIWGIVLAGSVIVMPGRYRKS
jgi:O-antigen ligase